MMNYLRKHPLNLVVLFVSFFFAVFFTEGAFASDTYESPQVLKADAVLPASFFKSDLYKIDQQVQNDGIMNTYRVTSRHGNFEVISTVALYKLIVEIEAIDAMTKVEQSESFTKSLKESGINTVEGVKSLFSDPEKSLEGAGKGLSNLFSRAQESVLRSNPGQTEDSRVQQLIGFSQSKREIARKYHVDVYSTNKVLQEHLDTLSWADYAGGITLSIATMPLGGPAKVVYSSSNAVRLLNDSIAMTPPSELKKQNREKLAKMQIDPNLADLFINNPHFSPRQQTYIVAALEAMTETRNREVALMVALQVKDPEMAMAVSSITMMFAGYNRNVAPIRELNPVMRIMAGVDAKGNRVLLAPVDYLTWNARVAGAVEEVGGTAGAGKGQVWILGTVSKRAEMNLAEKGWTVQTKVGGKIGVNELGLLKETKK